MCFVLCVMSKGLKNNTNNMINKVNNGALNAFR